MAFILRNVQTDFAGFQQLIDLYDHLKHCDEERIEIDMSDVTWFEANMCAPFGAVLSARQKAGSLRLFGVQQKVMSILRKNGFLPNFGFDRVKKPDTYGTTIEYQRFERSDVQDFKDYVARHFVGKGIPRMTAALHGKFRESISEVFQNAVHHSNSKRGIFACGQLFPGGTNRRLDFSVADLGDGMRKVILDNTGQDLSPEDAIDWAMKGANTTRRRESGTPGGLGLKLISEFLMLNGGRLKIASDAGYWTCYRDQVLRKKVCHKRFSSPFPGTVVNIEINAADKQSYCLESEIDAEDIF